MSKKAKKIQSGSEPFKQSFENLSIIRDLAVALEYMRAACEHSKTKAHQRAASVATRVLNEHKEKVLGFQGEGYWQEVKAVEGRYAVSNEE